MSTKAKTSIRAEVESILSLPKAQQKVVINKIFDATYRRQIRLQAMGEDRLAYTTIYQLNSLKQYANKKGRFVNNAASLVTSGSPELYNKLYTAIRFNRQMVTSEKGARGAFVESAEKYGLDADVIQNYAKQLQTANAAQNMTYESAAKLAVANARLSKGVEALRESWADNARTLNLASKDSYEWMEAATEVSKAMEEIFGVAVSTDFIDIYKDKIQTLVEGGDEAVKVFQELELLAGQDYVMSLSLDGTYQDQFKAMLQELTEKEKDLNFTIGFEGDISKYTSALEDLLNEGALTVDQVNAMFNSIGWAPEIKSETRPGPASVSITKTTTYGTESDAQGGKDNGSTSWQRIETSTEIPVFAIGDKAIATPKTTSSVKSTSSSSSSGGKTKKDKNTEAERYHEVSEELDDLQRKYDAIGKAKDRAFGNKRLKLIQDEIKATEDLIATQDEYISEIKTNLESDKSKLAEYGANFDEDGRLINYDEMVKVNVDQYNWAVDQFNNNKMSEEQFTKYEEAYERFMNDINQYEETLNLLEQEMEKGVELGYQLADAQLEDITYSIDFDISLAEDKLKLLDYQLKHLGNSTDDVKKKFTIFTEKMNINTTNAQTYRDGIDSILQLAGLSYDDISGLNSEALAAKLAGTNLTDDQIQKLRDYSSKLLDINSEMLEMRDTLKDELVAAFEEMNREAQEGLDTIDHLTNMIQGYRDIIDLVGADNLGVSNELINKMNQSNINNTKNALESSRRILEMNQSALADAQAKLDAATKAQNEEDIKFWSETVKTISQEVAASEEDMMSRWKAALQSAADAYTDSVNQVMDAFEKSMSGIAGSFDELQTKYDQQSEISERYLADYEKIYSLSKLSRDIEKSMDETDSVRAKSKLRDLQEEIYALQESGAEMTQYEVDELRAKYDLRLAEIALEEAQNAKSQVRMRRDSEGNWSYVYTADQDNIAAAEQNVEDKLYAYQNLTQERIKEMQDQMISLPREYADAIKAIAQDMTLTDEERKRKMEETTKYYQDKYKWLGDQLGIAVDSAKDLYNNEWLDYSEKTGFKISDNTKWVDSFNETLLAHTTGFGSLEDLQSSFTSSTTTMLSNLNTEYATYKNNLDGIMEAAGTSVEGFASTVDTEMDKIDKASDEASDKVEDVAEAGETGFSGLVDAAEDWLDDYENKIQPYIDKNVELANSVTNLVTAYGTLPEVLEEVKDSLEDVAEQAKETAATVELVDKGGPSGNKYDTETIKKAQQFVGLTGSAVDGIWGKQSAAAALDKNSSYTSLDKVVEAMRLAQTPEASVTTSSAYWGDARNYADQSWQQQKAKSFKLTKDNIAAIKSLPASRIAILLDNGTSFTADRTLLSSIEKTLGLYSGYESDDILQAISLGTGPRGYKLYDAAMFDTGGYTGEWDSSGRLAMLHQKELVLNAQDTENFLAAINIVRDIASMIDLRAAAQQSALSGVMQAYTTHNASQTVQQEVTIHAEFPNATNHSEIEAAFDSLINRAAQFANRKN